MHNSVDRKGVNFKPFDALEGYKESLEEVCINYLKEPKISLSSDQEEEINRNLTLAFKNNLFVIIRFYSDGYYKFHSGHIISIKDDIIFDDYSSIIKENVIEVMFV